MKRKFVKQYTNVDRYCIRTAYYKDVVNCDARYSAWHASRLIWDNILNCFVNISGNPIPNTTRIKPYAVGQIPHSHSYGGYYYTSINAKEMSETHRLYELEMADYMETT